jgi:hypothetical protein
VGKNFRNIKTRFNTSKMRQQRVENALKRVNFIIKTRLSASKMWLIESWATFFSTFHILGKSVTPFIL